MTESTGSGISGNELLKKNNKKCYKKYFMDLKLHCRKWKPNDYFEQK